ncbi:hypothetical protein [Sphingomonas paucimobilis]|uniref:hypothetical protein n=1 Tax=Sphingomonas paucimobilis TaxID=13689 RepID=UPI0028D5A841|nr:hypothetical protein [Sphingomonas paucimobilis]
MNVTLVTDLFIGLANGLMNVVIACIVVRWLLERVFDVDAPRLPAFLFVLGLTLGRFEDVADMAGHPVGRFVGDALAFTLIWYLWWRRPALRADAMEHP